MRRFAVLTGVIAAILAVAAPAMADPLKTNCPNGTDWEKMTVDDAAAAIWPFLLDPSPWADQDAFRDEVVAPADKNGDTYVCLKTVAQWNPNANWIDYPLFIHRDNNANPSSG